MHMGWINVKEHIWVLNYIQLKLFYLICMSNIGGTIWIIEPDPKLGGDVKIGNDKLVAHLNKFKQGKWELRQSIYTKFYELFHLMQF